MCYSGLAGRTLWTVTLAEILLVVISAARWREALDYDNNTTRSFEYLMDPGNPEDVYKYKDPCKAGAQVDACRAGFHPPDASSSPTCALEDIRLSKVGSYCGAGE
ncbi:UNVERIFIED_CONTAM: hypothetical protein FKN15_026624 [Acipenser sinensis]